MHFVNEIALKSIFTAKHMEIVRGAVI